MAGSLRGSAQDSPVRRKSSARIALHPVDMRMILSVDSLKPKELTGLDALDERDRQILALMQRDCRISNADLASAVGMSASALWRRVRALEDAGVIIRYGVEVDPARVGLEFRAIVHVQLVRHERGKLAEFMRAVETCPEIQDCYATTGQADYHLHVLCRDLAAYNRFLEEFLFRLPAVASAQTNVVLRAIKSSAAVRL